MQRAFLSYLGQFRLYSLVDLTFCLLATKAKAGEIVGSLLLWIGFLTLLEIRHNHHYRLKLSPLLPIALFAVGLVLYNRWEGLIFLGLSYAYTLKTNQKFGIFSPIIRGGQNLVLIGGLVGYSSILTWLALGLTIGRNILGDWRDADKDRAEKMETIPVFLGLHSQPYVHLLAVMATTVIWWNYANLAPVYLIAAIFVEMTSYNLTTR